MGQAESSFLQKSLLANSFFWGDTEEVTFPGPSSQLTISHHNSSSARNSWMDSMQFTVILQLMCSSLGAELHGVTQPLRQLSTTPCQTQRLLREGTR